MLERLKRAKHERERSRRTDGEVQRRSEDHHAAFGACGSCECEDAASEDDFFGERALRRPCVSLKHAARKLAWLYCAARRSEGEEGQRKVTLTTT